MPRPKAVDQIEALRRQREAIDQKLKAAEARQREKERADDQHRKLFAGTVALDHMAAHPASAFATTMRELLSRHATRAADKVVFAALLEGHAPSPAPTRRKQAETQAA